MNQTFDKMGRLTVNIDVNDLLHQMQYNYALLIFILSSVLLIYVLWNNFARSPSKKTGFKDAIKENMDIDKQVEGLFMEDLGVEPSDKIKRISRAFDSYMIVPALVLVYISISYLLSFRG